MNATEYPFVKILANTTPNPKAFESYYLELTSLGNHLYEILDQGKRWSQDLV